MRSASRAAWAAASAPVGAGVLGWPTSRWMTVSPAASFSAAAAITSMTMNGSTAPPRRESLPDIVAGLLVGEQRQAGAGRIDAASAGVAVCAQAGGTGHGIDIAALPATALQGFRHGLAVLDRGARHPSRRLRRRHRTAARAGKVEFAVAGIGDDHRAHRRRVGRR